MSIVDHSDRKSSDILTNLLNRLTQNSTLMETRTKHKKKERKLRSGKILQEPLVSNPKLDEWLIKKNVLLSDTGSVTKKENRTNRSQILTTTKKSASQNSSRPKLKNDFKEEQERSNRDSTKTCKEGSGTSRISTKAVKKDIKEAEEKPSKSKSKNATNFESKKKLKKTTSMPSVNKQTLITSFVSKSSQTKKVQENDSDSCELPSFADILNKNKKATKLLTTKKEQKALFKKYGVVLPTVDEILKEKEELEKDKKKLESFVPMAEDSLELPSFNLEQNYVKTEVLHCKHLTLKKLSKEFQKNLQYLSDIINGKVKNERHDRYFDKNSTVLSHSLQDLTCSTSTVVFSYEQKELLIELLKKHLDCDHSRTRYFFQVLLPELCLRIFMDTFKMDYETAVKHLDEQPILED